MYRHGILSIIQTDKYRAYTHTHTLAYVGMLYNLYTDIWYIHIHYTTSYSHCSTSACRKLSSLLVQNFFQWRSWRGSWPPRAVRFGSAAWCPDGCGGGSLLVKIDQDHGEVMWAGFLTESDRGNWGDVLHLFVHRSIDACVARSCCRLLQKFNAFWERGQTDVMWSDGF